MTRMKKNGDRWCSDGDESRYIFNQRLMFARKS